MNFKEKDIPFSSISICGLTTTLGRALFDILKKRGVDVISVTESDLRLPAPSLANKIEQTDGIINLFGDPYIAKWSGRYEFDIYKSRLQALRSIGLALRYASQRKRFLLTLSNAMVYDPFDVHDEYSSTYGESFMSEVGQMETKEAMRICQTNPDVRLLIIRMGYLMSSKGGAYPLLSALSRIGWGGCVDDGYQCLPMIHINDAVEGILRVASDQTNQGIFNLTIPEMASMNELVNAFTNSTSKNQHRLPKFILRLIAGRAIHLLEQNCKVLPKRLLESGFEFKYKNVNDIVSDLQKGKNKLFFK